ncbi:homoserine kinase [Desulfitispora alkaliphila]|uniref:homoserine kinase n=1 Tax=Desulfitispora alkaliphila TaxID=622674 RepID=UPI003D193DA5
MVTLRVPATSANVGPGFDAVGLALDLYNYVTITESEKFAINISGEGAQDIELGTDNIVYKAAQRVFDETGFKCKGLNIKLENHIPVARGLGSSAAALVGGVMGANILSGSQLTKQKLLEIVTDIEGHPDNVAPALFGGLVTSTILDTGDIVWRKVELDRDWKFVVAIPDFTLSTKLSREALPEQIPFTDAVYNISRVGLVVLAFQNRDLRLLGQIMEDCLHQPYRSALVPGMTEVLKKVKQQGRPVALSGAGPTVLAIADFDKEAREIGKLMADTFAEHQVNCLIQVLDPNNTGAEVI